MARITNRLNASEVKTLGPGRHSDGGGLYLFVDGKKPPKPDEGQSTDVSVADEKPGRRTKALKVGKPEQPVPPEIPNHQRARRWVFRYRFKGSEIDMGLGSFPAITLARAREIAAINRTLLAENKDPLGVRRSEAEKASTATFGQVADELWHIKEGGWRSDRYTKSWLTSLQVYAARIWDEPVDEVGIDDMLAILRPIWTAKAETAAKVRGRCERVLDAARAKGLIDTNKANPARWRGNLDQFLGRREKLQRGHHPALSYLEIGEFMTELRQREAPAALLLELTILTCVRSGESRLLTWNEVDLNAKMLRVPKDKTKSNRANNVPLSDAAIAVLTKMLPHKTADDSLVFPGRKAGKPLSVMSMDMLLRRMKQEITVHGFRSTFRDWADELTNAPHHIAEACLSHVTGNDPEKAYRRTDNLDKRRALLNQWADYCAGPQVDNVVQLARPA